jgi:hypothetical protein
MLLLNFKNEKEQERKFPLVLLSYSENIYSKFSIGSLPEGAPV